MMNRAAVQTRGGGKRRDVFAIPYDVYVCSGGQPRADSCEEQGQQLVFIDAADCTVVVHSSRAAAAVL